MTFGKLTIGYLYPDIMGCYGDRGNLAAVLRRCGWRGIATDVLELNLGDPVDPGDADLFLIGHGGAYNTNSSFDTNTGLITIFLVQHAGWKPEGKKIQPAFQKAAVEIYGKTK